MNKSRNISDEELTVKDQPHREMTATRADYGFPAPGASDDSICFVDSQPVGSDVEISQPNIEEVEVILS